MAAPQIRVGIDWDNNGIIYWEPERPANAIEDKPLFATLGVWNTAPSNVVDTQLVNSKQGATIGGPVNWLSIGFSYPPTVYLGRDRTTFANAAPTHRYTFNTGGLTKYLYYSFMVRAYYNTTVSYAGTATVTPAFRSTVGGADTTGTPITFVTSGEWQRVTVRLETINTGSNVTRYPTIRLTMPNISGTGGSPVFLEFMDYCIALSDNPGLSSLVYNDGTTPTISDNITPYVLEASWSLGSQDSTRKISGDSTAVITLNNQSGAFTPEGTGIYGAYIKPNIRGIIQLYNSATAAWVTMWTGFVKRYEVSVDSNPLEKRVTIELENNLFSLKSASVSFQKDNRAAVTLATSTANQVMRMLIEHNAPNTAFSQPSFQTDVSRTDQCLMLAADAALLTPDTNWQKTLSYVGEDWDGKSYSAILKAIVDTEQGWLFTRRDGTLLFKGGYAFRTGGSDTPVTLNLNTQAQDMVLSYGDNQQTATTVDYLYTARPTLVDLLPVPPDGNVDNSDETEDFTRYWGKKTNIGVAAFKMYNASIARIAVWSPGPGLFPSTETFIPPQNYPKDSEGSPNTREERYDFLLNGGFPNDAWLLDFDSAKMDIVKLHGAVTYTPTPSNISTIKGADTTGGGQYYAVNTTISEWSFAGPNFRQLKRDKSKVKLMLHNYGGYPATFECDPVSIRATVNIIGDRERVTVRSSTPALGGLTPETFEVSDTLLTSRAAATTLANFILADYASYGYNVDSVKLIVADDADAKYNKILALETGTAVTFTEAYYNLNAALHVVVGEKHVFKNNVLTSDLFCTDRSDKMSYATATGSYP